MNMSNYHDKDIIMREPFSITMTTIFTTPIDTSKIQRSHLFYKIPGHKASLKFP